MAAIKETLALEDQFSAAFSRYMTLVEQGTASTKELQSALANVSQGARVAATAYDMEVAKLDAAAASARAQAAQTEALAAQERLQAQRAKEAAKAEEQHDAAQNKAAKSADSLTSKLKSLAGAYLGMQGLQTLVNMSDEITAINGRLQLMTGSAEAAADAQDKIYQAAMRSRGAYTDMADMVAQLGMMAPDAFGNTDELIAFAEQLQKQMTISGASGQSAAAAMTQLTQALASGVLRGDELNSVMEQTPKIAQTIADYMGITTGQLRDIASEGQVTAEVVKNAILSAADETNAAFAEMPMTWSQVWTQMQNIAIKALDPVLDGVNWLANQVDNALSWIEEHADGVAAVLAGLGAIALVAGAQMAASALMSAIAWAAANWPILLVGASVAALIYAALKAGATFEEVGGVIGGVFGVVYASIMNNFIVPLQQKFAAIANFIGNVFNDPVTAIKVLFCDMVLSILGQIGILAQGIEDLLNQLPGVEVNLTSRIDRLTNSAQTARQNAINSGNYTEYVKAWDYMDYADAWNQGAEIGSRFGSAIENFSLSDAISGLNGNLYGDLYNVPSYDDMLGTLDDISGNVSSIKKSVDLSNEDIKSLVDVATRRYVNQVNLTSQTPVITVNGQNTGNTEADRKAVADQIAMVLVEQVSAGAFRAIARPI